MLELQNKTSFAVAMVPGLDHTGLETLTVVIKGTFLFVPGQTDLQWSDEQQPIRFTDEYYGEPAASSVRYEADTAPGKRGTDVVLVGQAISTKPVRTLDVILTAGSLAGVVRVFGDRQWYRSLGEWKASEPLPFLKMPLTYEKAFGGADTNDPDPAKHTYEPRNPVGIGYVGQRSQAQLEGMLLPNIEDPRALLEKPMDHPAPAGFGFVSRAWMPRRAYAGTYDEHWRRERFPFLPEDFDIRFYDAASAHLTSEKPFQGAESVVVTNVSIHGDVRFSVPKRLPMVTISTKGKPLMHAPELATLLIEPDDSRVSLTWRVTVPCPRNFLYIDFVRITEEAPS